MTPLLYNTPHDEGSLFEWASIHQKDHFAIAAEIQRKLSGTTVILMPIDPIPLQADMLTWAMNHQLMHSEMDDAVGVAGFDLTAVNFSQRQELEIWIQLHAAEHYEVWQNLARLQPGGPEISPTGPPTPAFGETQPPGLLGGST